MPDDEPTPLPSEVSSFRSSRASLPDDPPSQRGSSGGGRELRARTMKVVVPDGMEPGRQVKLRYPDGRKFRACIPPRERWGFENCDGSPPPYFLAPVDPTEATEGGTARPPPPTTRPGGVRV